MHRKRPEGIKDYTGPAGGWGALKAVALTLKAQQIVQRGAQTLLKSNQPDGFDCPSCAWPDPKHTSSFEFCENGAKAVAWESTAKRIGADFFAQHSVAEIWEQSDHWIEGQGRITDPLRYNAETDHYEVVEWDEAFAAIGAGLARLDDPNQAEFYTSGRCSNEAAFLYQLFARLYGTNNFPDCSNMCHEATSVGLPQSIGIGKGTVSLEDFDHADLILSIGHNPGTNHPRMMATLREVARRGGRIIVFNPLKERSLERFESPQSVIEMATFSATPIATNYLQVKVGGDAAALKGIAKALVAMDKAATAAGEPAVLDHAFIAEHTAGFDALVANLEGSDWADIVHASGLGQSDLEEVARLYAQSTATIACYGMGITQHRTGTSNVQQIANLLLLRGNMGRPGAGICPLRGHSNVQGDRTVGITERPTAALLDKIKEVFAFEPPRAHGHSVVESIAAMRDGKAKAIVCLGGNLAIASSDPQACAQGFRNMELAVHITTKLNRTQLLMAKGDTYILPCLGRTERDLQDGTPQAVTVEDSMSMVHASRGFLMPPGDNVRSEPWIVAHIAKATLGGKGGIDWDGYVANYDLIRDKIEAVFPAFKDYNNRIREPGGFHLPNSAAERVWNTDTGKANFIVSPGVEEDETTADPTVMRLTTLRSHDQYNTTIYALDDRYRGVFGRRDILFMNAKEIARLGFAEGDVIDVTTALQFKRDDRIVQGLTLVEHALPDGCCASYYPETQPLIALEDHDLQSLTPSYKSVPVQIRPAGPDDGTERLVARAGVIGRSVEPKG
ncbi:FdhF/YdeP family oxidoreductase [Sphingomonas ginsenosidivorax]|uniref:FdhF/YdeP family oxidoreductase n=1 Tax=Sphingomonas ginsenosidivorax TaxID=862135 RepID=A0A5C6U7U0_9SPHN|nr:FdhF/YdeP family oxidoreductase [Sphingomonas ginsenosidivorax]TXC67926.1 FdhF/YdeP family oxidoreductase [Sphingomonas ginsenosidivorax]TXC68038.1 FdhF/YdeP family oxidoreductase [Sphingomonas ginsenosidivorax]